MQRLPPQKELFQSPRKFELLPFVEKPLNAPSKLFQLLESENLTLDLLVYYLSKRFSQSGVRNFLINKLYQLGNDDLTFYIPELCYIVIKRESQELERFLLDKCAKSMQLYFQIHWSLSSYGEANSGNPEKYDKLKKLIKYCELSMINRERIDETTNQRSISRSDLRDPQRFAQIAMDKESRMDYNTTVNKFISNLIKISLTLKSYKIDERKDRLKYYINRANVVLESNRKKISNVLSDFNQSVYYQGISLPFSNWEDSRFHSNLMVKILNHDFTCFNTKKRVPYKIVVETVEYPSFLAFPLISISVEDFKIYTPNFSIPEEEPQILPKSSKSYNDWEIIDEFYDSTLASSKAPDTKSNKLNKYQGLEEYMRKVAEDEAKKLMEERNEKKNWLIPNLAIKLPRFLNLSKNQSDERLQLLENRTIIEERNESKRAEKRQGLFVPTRSRKINVHNIETPISNKTKTQGSVNKRRKILNRTGSLDRLKPKDLDSPDIRRRKLSFKVIDNKDRLEFLQKLRPRKTDDPYKAEGFRLTVHRIEEKLLAELESERRTHEDEQRGQRKDKEEIKVRRLGPWDEIWEDKAEVIKRKSPYGHFPSYKLRCMIVKGGDDLRQEILAMQLIIKFKQIFEKANIKLYLRPYEIIVTSANSGILEFIPNTIAIDGLKKKYPNTSLLQFYRSTWGFGFEEAQKNFVESLAAYSLVAYFLQIKDRKRHNGNILIDAKGYILHIDFGFMLAFSPGGINFESAPFKFTLEYLELMGGKDSNMFDYYKCLVTEGFKELRKHVEELSFLLEIMMEESDLPCFTQFRLDLFKERFKEGYTDDECEAHVEKLIENSLDNWWTAQYDNFQKMTNGINP